METTERLEEGHAESDSLDGVEHAEPEPEAGPEEGTGRAGPREHEADAARAPEHLAPSRRSETDGEDREEPRVNLGEAREHEEDEGPSEVGRGRRQRQTGQLQWNEDVTSKGGSGPSHSNEEHQDHDEDVLRLDGGVVPQILPVATVRTWTVEG